MSKGVFKYPRTSSHYDSSYRGEVIDSHKFFTSDLAQRKKRILVGGMEIPENILDDIDVLIGHFLLRIQEVAFVPVDQVVQAVYRGTPEEMFGDGSLYHGDDRDRALDRFGYFTTLSPELLASTVRLHLKALFADILRVSGKSEILGKAASEDLDKQPPLPGQITKFTPEISILSAQTRRLLRAMDVQPEGVNALTSHFADMVMNRSSLSLPSVRHDLYRVLSRSLDNNAIRDLSERLAQSREYKRIKPYEGSISIGVIRDQSPQDEQPEHKNMYSTLHPEDLMRSVRGFVEFIEAGIITECLDESGRRRVTERLEAYDRKAQDAA